MTRGIPISSIAFSAIMRFAFGEHVAISTLRAVETLERDPRCALEPETQRPHVSKSERPRYSHFYDDETQAEAE